MTQEIADILVQPVDLKEKKNKRTNTKAER